MIKSCVKILSLSLILISSAHAGDISVTLAPSQISLTYVHTSKNLAPGAENTAIIATSALQSPCTKGVYIDLDRDALAYETMLKGLSLGKNLQILYNNSMTSPWGDKSWCAVTAAGIQW